ncbi:carbon storage regulator CsrA [Pirellulales bacterium]|nr:carbon storage regulator CsrA [Pirellulales bacterium]
MLVLSRNPGEQIRIGEEIAVVVVAVRGDQVRLGIEAPPHVPVYRKEILDLIRSEPNARAEK